MKPKSEKKRRPVLEASRRLRRNRGEPAAASTDVSAQEILRMLRPTASITPLPSCNTICLRSADHSAATVSSIDDMSIGSSTSLEVKEDSMPSSERPSAAAASQDNTNIYAYRDPALLTGPSQSSLTTSTCTTVSDGGFVQQTTSDPNVVVIKEKLQCLELVNRPNQEEAARSLEQFRNQQPLGIPDYNQPSTSSQFNFAESSRMFQQHMTSNFGCNLETRGRWQDLLLEDSGSFPETTQEASDEVREIRPRTRHGRGSRMDAPSCINLMASLEEEGRGDEGYRNRQSGSQSMGPWYLTGHNTRNVGYGPLEGSTSTEDFLNKLPPGTSKKRKSEYLEDDDEDESEDDSEDSDGASELYYRAEELENDEATTHRGRKRKGEEGESPKTAKKAKERGRRTTRGRKTGSESD